MNDVATLEEDIRKAFSDPENYLVPTGISRYDRKSGHGWWVRLHRGGETHSQYFPDSAHDTVENSLIAALASRHSFIQRQHSQTTFIHARTLPLDPNQRIHRNIDPPNGPGRKPYEYWMAVWYDQGHNRRTKNFSVNKFGEEVAKFLALREAEANHNTQPKITRTDANKKYGKWTKKSRSEIAKQSKEFIPYLSHRDRDSNKEILQAEPFSHEGDRYFQLHFAIERDRKLRDSKLTDHLSKHQRLFCEICSFNFLEFYPFLECDIIQVHHVTPLSELTSSTVTRLSDLMLLCANCHFAIHQGDAIANVIHAFDCIPKDC